MTHRPSHISKMVLPTVQLGPPLFFLLALLRDTFAISEVVLNLKVVTESSTELVQYQLLLVREIKKGRPITYPGYARVKREGRRPTILAEGTFGKIKSYKGALQQARYYLGRSEKGQLPAPWEEIEGVVLTMHRGNGKVSSLALAGQDVLRGPRKTRDTTEWLFYLDKHGDEFRINPLTRGILGV